jgi:flagellar protein FliO/FliZ
MSPRALPVVTAILTLSCGRAMSAEPAVAGTSSLVAELAAILLPLAFIIIGLLVVLRLLRRRYGLSGPDAPLSIVQILPLGPRERLVLVKSRSGRVFTIGVGTQAVTYITELDSGELVPTNQATPLPGAGGDQAPRT